jgi:hypothetical protein
MDAYLNQVLTYFSYFHYTPSWAELYLFFPVRIPQTKLRALLRKKKLNVAFFVPQNTPPQYSTSWRFRLYFQSLRWCPLVRFVGITGASAMRGLRPTDDIDLCIVTSQSLIWTTRLYTVILAKLLGIHTKTGVCLNLFFDEGDLSIAYEKQNSYIAHELLQMKPLVDKNQISVRFLQDNRWLLTYFPNAVTKLRGKKYRGQTSSPIHNRVSIFLDSLFRFVQLPIIKRNKTSLFINATQLWLFKNDFEKKLKRRGLVI